MRCFIFILSVICLFASHATAALRPNATVNRYNITVFADEASQADLAAIQAEQTTTYFFDTFKLKNEFNPNPILLSLEGSPNVSDEEGLVRIFVKNDSIKIQTSWPTLPVSRFSFHRGCVRSLCARLAIENLRSGATTFEEFTDIFLPMWISDGLAATTADPDTIQQLRDRASLLARTEPQLSLQKALVELETCSRLDPNQQAIAMTLCQALTSNPSSRAKVFSSLVWDSNTRGMTWLKKVLPNTDLNTWWQKLWEAQAFRASIMRLGFNTSTHWILYKKNESQFKTRDRSTPKENESKIEVIPVLHPWLKNWTHHLSDFDPSNFSDPELQTVLKETIHRRQIALDWFANLDSPKPSLREMLLFQCSQNQAIPATLEPGPAMKWFQGLK